jgi:hypothetical protein
MKKVTIIIPKRDNEGKKFSTAMIAEIRKDILRKYNGYTVKNVRGAWKGEDGKTYLDESWEYTMVTDDEGVKWIEGWLVKIKDLLRQEAMYLEVTEINIKFL